MRLRDNLQCHYTFRHDNGNWDRDSLFAKLYIKSDWKPDPASKEIKKGINDFKQAVLAEQAKRCRTSIPPNLSPLL